LWHISKSAEGEVRGKLLLVMGFLIWTQKQGYWRPFDIRKERIYVNVRIALVLSTLNEKDKQQYAN
jgi:hypothetical protein